jgi:hypothetical protein
MQCQMSNVEVEIFEAIDILSSTLGLRHFFLPPSEVSESN